MAAMAAASSHHQLAVYRLFHALASWSRTSASSTVSTMTATPRITQRSHQYLPLVGRAWLRASLAGASWDTPFRVAVQVARILSRTQARRGRFARTAAIRPAVTLRACPLALPLILSPTRR